MNDIDWDFWLNMPTVTIWQACALSLNIDPDKMKQHPDGYMTPGGFLFKDESFPTIKEKEKFEKHLRLLCSHVFNTQYIRIASEKNKNAGSEIYLTSFVKWALVDTINWDIPKELVALAKLQTETTEDQIEDIPIAIIKSSKVRLKVSDKRSWPPPQPSDPEPEREEIHTLFDPMKQVAISVVFDKVDSKWWNKSFSRASRNGLSDAREGDTLPYQYNPAKVADWLVREGHYSREHVDRKLANNLPERSKDKKYLITGELD